MPKKRFSAEQIVTLLRQIEVLTAQGKSAPEACRDAGICSCRSRCHTARQRQSDCRNIRNEAPKQGNKFEILARRNDYFGTRLRLTKALALTEDDLPTDL
jgi:hypothetical protein